MSDSSDATLNSYKDLIKDFEERSKVWGATEESLMASLALLAGGARSFADEETSLRLDILLGKLKGGLTAAEIEKELSWLKNTDIAPQLSAGGESTGAGAGQLPALHEAFIQIIEEMPLPADLALESAELKKTIARGITLENYAKSVSAIASLVLALRSKSDFEKRQIESLMDEVRDRLSEMGSSADLTFKNVSDGFRANEQLEEKVRREVDTIEGSAAKARDLEQFRKELNLSLDLIRRSMAQKRQDDRTREEQLAKEVENLKGHVKDLEKDVEIQKAGLKKALDESRRDGLTGILNRLAFNELAAAEHARAVRYDQTYSVAIFDIDKFKMINDQFGHPAGDHVLATIAQLAARQFRAADIFCRYGGEEFIAILPQTDIEGGFSSAEKVRLAVEEFVFHYRGKRVPVTISCGVAQYKAGDTPSALVERADKALYQAKADGRNLCRAG